MSVYNKTHLNNILKKHLEKKHPSGMSTFFNDTKSTQSNRQICMLYYFFATKKLAPVFRKHDIKLATKNSNTIRSLLGSNKDPFPILKKSGIYEVSCQLDATHCIMEKQ